MKLKDTDLEKFISIYKQTYGETLTKEDALPKAIALLTLIKLTYKPIPKNYYETIQQKGN
jgi:hypothetical protein